MLSDYKRFLGSMATIATLLFTSAPQAQEELETVGLSVYTETARDIYMAGLLLPYGAVMQNLMLSPPPKAMEYRIATRRISSRGFSGTLLLQGELGSGGRAPESAVKALGELKVAMRGSLRQGDRFVIYLNENDETLFLLNGTELVRVSEGEVFDFFYSGWAGAGAATTFSEPLLSGTIEPAMMERFNALTPSEERVALIAAWSEPGPAPEPTPAPAPEPAALEPEPVAPAPEPVQVAAAPAPQAAPALAAAAPVAVAAAPEPAPQAAPEPAPAPAPEPTPEPAPAPAPEQVAMAEIPSDAAEQVDNALSQLDDREYQRQLQEYVSLVMRQVYGEVKYPRRAIKYEWEGRVELLARLDESGDLIEVVIDSTSGHVGLDKAAETAVKRAAPFPELTAVAREELVSDEGDSYVMAIPVTFALQR